MNWGKNDRIPVEEVAESVNSILKKHHVNEEGSEKRFGDNEKSSEKKFGEITKSKRSVEKNAQRIIDLVIADPSISAKTMAHHIGVSSRAVEKQIAKLRTMGILTREGADYGGYWRIIVKP